MPNKRTGPDYLDRNKYDPEVLKKYPHNPVETFGVGLMRDKMQRELNKKKNKSK